MKKIAAISHVTGFSEEHVKLALEKPGKVLWPDLRVIRMVAAMYDLMAKESEKTTGEGDMT